MEGRHSKSTRQAREERFLDRFNETSLWCPLSCLPCVPRRLLFHISDAIVGGKKSALEVLPFEDGSRVTWPPSPWTSSARAPRSAPSSRAQPPSLDDLGKKVDVYDFKYILPESVKKKDKAKEKEAKKEKAENFDFASRMPSRTQRLHGSLNSHLTSKSTYRTCTVSCARLVCLYLVFTLRGSKVSTLRKQRLS